MCFILDYLFHMFSHHFTPSLGTCEWTWMMTAQAVTAVGSSMRWTARKKTCNWNGAFELELSNNVWTVWHWTDIVTIVGQFSRGRGVRTSALRKPQCTGRKVQDLPILRNIEHRFDMNWTILHYTVLHVRGLEQFMSIRYPFNIKLRIVHRFSPSFAIVVVVFIIIVPLCLFTVATCHSLVSNLVRFQPRATLPSALRPAAPRCQPWVVQWKDLQR